MRRRRREALSLARPPASCGDRHTRGSPRRSPTRAAEAASSTRCARASASGGGAMDDGARSVLRGRRRPAPSHPTSEASAAARTARGRKLTMVSIMSIGAGSVGVSARPALPTTMSTSGNRHRIMSLAFRSSTDSATDARGTVMGMSMSINSSSGVMNSRDRGSIIGSMTRAESTRKTGPTTAPQRLAASRQADTIARASVPR